MWFLRQLPLSLRVASLAASSADLSFGLGVPPGGGWGGGVRCRRQWWWWWWVGLVVAIVAGVGSVAFGVEDDFVAFVTY